jgi:RNA polymerase sigma factor (TIGR02999 family)
MSELTKIFEAVEAGDTEAGEHLLPLAYEELRRIAISKMAGERDGHTLQATALVHEAYLRLLGPDGKQRQWDSQGHFFTAAAEAMRRILVDSARRKKSLKRGGDAQQVTFNESRLESAMPSDEILAIDEALEKLEAESPEFAKVVKLRYYAGLTLPETAASLGISESTVQRTWRTARAWLYREIAEQD